MIPLEGLAFEEEGRDDGEDGQGNDFLDDFQLHQIEWTAVFDEADPVGWDLCAIFEERDSP